jgi:hypothetical protein
MTGGFTVRGRRAACCLAVASLLVGAPVVVRAQSTSTIQVTPTTDPCASEEPGKPATVEFVLSSKHKDRVGEVTRLLNTVGEPVTVRIKFFPFLDPPANIGIGQCVSAAVGRVAIRAAAAYGTGITRLIRQDILPHRWVKVGATDTAELAWIAVSADDLKRLADPALTTGQFQTLYRQLAAPKERKLPFGMGSVPLEQQP